MPPSSPDVALRALVPASTDIIVAEVLRTQPVPALEGARDTVALEVVRSLLGPLAPADRVEVYYHLLWIETPREAAGVRGTLEPPKFQKGDRCLLFLRRQLEDSGDGPRRLRYDLTDERRAVLPDEQELEQEVAREVRKAHGDSRGEWSSTEASIAGLQGRLLAYRGAASGGLEVYLELRNTAGGDNSVDFDLTGAGSLVWSVTGPAGAAVASSSLKNERARRPSSVRLSPGQGARLLLTLDACADCLALPPDREWRLAARAGGPYTLSGRITIAPTGAPRRWFGTLQLPPLLLPLERR